MRLRQIPQRWPPAEWWIWDCWSLDWFTAAPDRWRAKDYLDRWTFRP